MSSSEYVCPHCWKGQLLPLKRKQWPECDYTVRGWRQCNACSEVAEVPANLAFCSVTILLAIGMLLGITFDRIVPSIQNLVAGKSIISSIVSVAFWGLSLTASVAILKTGVRTWRYTKWYRGALRERGEPRESGDAAVGPKN